MKSNQARESLIEYGPLQDLVGYQVRRTYGQLYRTFIETFKALKLAPGQYSVLVLIGLNPGLSQLDLAEASGVDGSTIVPITERFTKLGWIKRTRRSDDRRHYALQITAAGQAILDKARPLIVAREKEIAAILSASERRALIDMLRRINESPQPGRARSRKRVT